MTLSTSYRLRRILCSSISTVCRPSLHGNTYVHLEHDCVFLRCRSVVSAQHAMQRSCRSGGRCIMWLILTHILQHPFQPSPTFIFFYLPNFFSHPSLVMTCSPVPSVCRRFKLKVLQKCTQCTLAR